MALTFNSTYYYANRADVLEAYLNSDLSVSAYEFALNHYNTFGWKEGANPNEVFNTNEYLDANPDVEIAGVNPFDHYNNHGQAEGRAPNAKFPPLAKFDHVTYLAENPDLGLAGITTAAAAYDHYITFGYAEVRPGKPDLDTDWNAPSFNEALAALAEAQEAAAEATVAYSDALLEAGLVSGPDADEDGVADDFVATTNYVLQAEQAELTARVSLNDARATDTDAKLAKDLADAQKAVNEDDAVYTAAGSTPTAIYSTTDTATFASGYTTLSTATNAQFVGYVDAASTDDEITVDLTANTVTAVGSANPVDAVNSSLVPVYSAAQLQARAKAAAKAEDAHVAANGETITLATSLEEAIALYLTTEADVANTPLGDLKTAIDALQTAHTAFEAAGAAGAGAYDTALNTFYDAVQDAFDDVFAGADDASLLKDGARGDAIEALLTTLNVRADLDDTADATAAAFNLTANAAALNTAQTAVDDRADLIEAVATAQANLVAVTDASEAYSAAQDAVAAAAEALGLEVDAIDSAAEFGTDAADLFTFNADDVDGITAISINGLSADDVVYLGTNYTQATEATADNNVLEYFVTEIGGNAVIQIENEAYGSQTDDFTTITLTGVAVADLNIDNGIITIA